MSFREKSAWISFLSIALVYGIYFASVFHLLPAGWSSGDTFRRFLVLVIALVVLEVGLHVVVAIQSPRDARTPKDERERLIAMKATRVAFPVLLVGTFAAIGTIHLPMGRWEMAQVMFFAIVAAELTRFGAEIVYHRRGF
jgi:archaellum biogenesis protein FlaJ (TadC family)